MKRVVQSLTAVACCLALHAPAQDVRIPSTPDTVIRGIIPANRAPIMRVKPGQHVTIDTLSHQGLNTGDDPIAFFARGGIPREQVLQDAVDVYGRVKPPPGMGAHVLTGPVYVEGAEPGDMATVSSRPPGAFGGNLDLKQLTRGSTLYLPVYNAGALFFTGDAHAAQGDGEVNGTAIETSLTPTFQFIVHKAKGKNLVWPRAENATHYISMGVDKDLNLAMKGATQEAVNILMQEKGLTAAEAYQVASIAVDFRVAESVNLNQVVYGMIPKNIFKKQTPYWYKP
jgi:acetamidase/formamidase